MKSKTIWLFVAGTVTYFYTAFVLMNLWNWFAAPAFHTDSLSFFQILGVLLLVKMFTEQRAQGFEDATRWEILFKVLDFIIPAERMHEVREIMEAQEQTVWWKAGWIAVSKFLNDTFVLGLGWLLHLFL